MKRSESVQRGIERIKRKVNYMENIPGGWIKHKDEISDYEAVLNYIEKLENKKKQRTKSTVFSVPGRKAKFRK